MTEPVPQATDVTARAALQERWHALTRTILPGMATAHGWPIRFDHCFMRVCLDAAVGVRWDRVVPRPAIRHLTDAQLGRAVSVAEGIAADPASLRRLNGSSLRMRGGHGARATPEPGPATPRLHRVRGDEMNTSSKIPATDRSGGGPGSSHANADKPHDGDVAGAHHQHSPVTKKHPGTEDNSTGGGTKHEKHHPGESGRS